KQSASSTIDSFPLFLFSRVHDGSRAASGFPQPGDCFAVAPATVTHTHSRCAAARIGATPVRGIVYRESTLPERPKPLAPAVLAMQEQTARACSCLGGGG